MPDYGVPKMNEQVIVDKRGNPLVNSAAAVSRFMRYLAGSPTDRVRSFYELNGRRITGKSAYRDVLGLKSLYVNYGWWTPGCTDHDAACEALAEKLGEAAGISEGDRVLDVGFGYAEQDFHWVRTRKPEQIVGLNVTTSQVEIARERAAEMNLSDRVDLRVGSATAVPFEAGSFDRVVALESACHFDTRQMFFEEAFRVLRPGGVIATADLVPRLQLSNGKTLTARADRFGRSRVIPHANWYSRAVYAERLKEAGFTDVDVQDVSDKVLIPQASFARKRLSAADSQHLTSLQKRNMKLYADLVAKRAVLQEYIIAVARKPGGDES